MTLWAFGFEAIGVIEGSNFKLLWTHILESVYVPGYTISGMLKVNTKAIE